MKTAKSNGHGGKREGCGRKVGTRTKASVLEIAALADLAKPYAPAAIKRLAHIVDHGESEASQVAASCALLDRGYGRPKQITENTTTLNVQVSGARDKIAGLISGLVAERVAAGDAQTGAGSTNGRGTRRLDS